MVCFVRDTMYTCEAVLKVRTVICGRLAVFLRVRNAATVPADRDAGGVSQSTRQYANGHPGHNGNGQVLPVVDNEVTDHGCCPADHGDNPPLSVVENTDVAVTEFAVMMEEFRRSTPSDVLHNIRDLLGTRLRADDRLRRERDWKQQTMHEWMIAAAVIDRVCFIVFSLCFIIGTVVMFVVATYTRR